MKFSIARSELLDALSVVGKGMSARTTLPILAGVLVVCDEGSLRLQSTDLEVSVKHSVAALVEKEGQAVFPGRLFSDIVRSLPEAAVGVEVDGDVAHVRCGQASFTLKTLPAADFPRFPEISATSNIEIPGTLLSQMVRQVAKAVSRDETRAILTGILTVVEGPSVKMVATDSYRLAVKEVVLPERIGEDIEVVIPGRALEEATKLAAGVESVKIGVSENQVIFEFGDTTFVTRRIEGTFPNYRQLIPKDTATTAELSNEEFQGAVKRVSLMAQHNTPLRIAVNVPDHTLSLSATTQDIGDASEDLMVAAQGENVEIAFNHTFLMDGLASAGSDSIVLEIVSALKPGLIRTVGEEGFLYLLMPVRLG